MVLFDTFSQSILYPWWFQRTKAKCLFQNISKCGHFFFKYCAQQALVVTISFNTREIFSPSLWFQKISTLSLWGGGGGRKRNPRGVEGVYLCYIYRGYFPCNNLIFKISDWWLGEGHWSDLIGKVWGFFGNKNGKQRNNANLTSNICH